MRILLMKNKGKVMDVTSRSLNIPMVIEVINVIEEDVETEQDIGENDMHEEERTTSPISHQHIPTKETVLL